MAIKGPSLKKEISTTPVINFEPKALANSYAYTVKKAEAGGYIASVAELPELTVTHVDFIAAQNSLKEQVCAQLTALPENERPIPVGISKKSEIDRAKEVPKHIRKDFGRQMNQ